VGMMGGGAEGISFLFLLIQRSCSTFFLLAKFRQKPKFKIQQWIVFEGFQSPEVRFLIFLNQQIPVFDFQCVAKYREGWLKNWDFRFYL
jgi:hypothetical protein